METRSNSTAVSSECRAVGWKIGPENGRFENVKVNVKVRGSN